MVHFETGRLGLRLSHRSCRQSDTATSEVFLPRSVWFDRMGQRVVHPLSDRDIANCSRCVSPQHSKSGPKLTSACHSKLRKAATESLAGPSQSKLGSSPQ